MFRGDLDWITMKALEKDRTRRYESASGLATDVLRYLHDEPVEASPPSTGYRLRKLARRHRAALVTAAAFASLLIAAAIVSTWLAFRADRNATLAAQSAERAEAQQKVADEQRSLAEIEKGRADSNAARADRGRQQAEIARKVAEVEKRRADTNAAEAERRRVEDGPVLTLLACAGLGFLDLLAPMWFRAEGTAIAWAIANAANTASSTASTTNDSVVPSRQRGPSTRSIG